MGVPLRPLHKQPRCQPLMSQILFCSDLLKVYPIGSRAIKVCPRLLRPLRMENEVRELQNKFALTKLDWRCRVCVLIEFRSESF